jgi:hypothetical protein
VSGGGARSVRVDVSDIRLTDPTGTPATVGPGVVVLVLMRHRH